MFLVFDSYGAVLNSMFFCTNILAIQGPPVSSPKPQTTPFRDRGYRFTNMTFKMTERQEVGYHDEKSRNLVKVIDFISYEMRRSHRS